MDIKYKIAFVLFFCFLTSSVASAEEAIGEGVVSSVDQEYKEIKGNPDLVFTAGSRPWRLEKILLAGTKYDTNIFLSNVDKKSDFISFLSASLRAYRRGGQLKLDVTYTPTYQYYLHSPGQSSLSQSLLGQAEYEHQRWIFKASNNFLSSSSPANSEQTGLIKTMQDSGFFETKYLLTRKVAVAFTYQVSVLLYQQSALNGFNYYDNSFGGRLYYHLRPRLDLYAALDKDITTFPSGSGSNSGYSGYVGMTGRVTSKTAITVEGGIKQATYQSNSSPNFMGFWIQGILKHALTTKTDLILQIKDDVQASTYQGAGYYQTISFEPSLSYKLTTKMKLTLGASLRENSYPTSTVDVVNDTGETKDQKRMDLFYGDDLRLDYQIKRDVKLSLAYTFEQRSSNFSPYNYDDETYSVNVEAKF